MLPGETILSGAKNNDHVSEFQVMQSPAGWYIGTIYTYCGNCAECLQSEHMAQGCQEPNTRETGYFATEKEAEMALRIYKEKGYLLNQR